MSQPRFSFSQSILFIDEQTKFENLIRNGLLTFPAEYEYCPSRIASALERFRGEAPDLIVTAIEFSDGNVLDLIKKSGNLLEAVPAICLTEPHMADVEAELAAAGRVTLVERASEPLALIRKMAQVIAENSGKERPPLVPALSATQIQKDWAGAILKKIK